VPTRPSASSEPAPAPGVPRRGSPVVASPVTGRVLSPRRLRHPRPSRCSPVKAARRPPWGRTVATPAPAVAALARRKRFRPPARPATRPDFARPHLTDDPTPTTTAARAADPARRRRALSSAANVKFGRAGLVGLGAGNARSAVPLYSCLQCGCATTRPWSGAAASAGWECPDCHGRVEPVALAGRPYQRPERLVVGNSDPDASSAQGHS
jgi:hypothetical protein